MLRYNHRYRKNKQEEENLLENEVRKYLNTTPAKDQRREKLEIIKEKLKKMGISVTEFLQIANLMPSTTVELYLIIPNIEERFTDAQISEILSIIR